MNSPFLTTANTITIAHRNNNVHLLKTKTAIVTMAVLLSTVWLNAGIGQQAGNGSVTSLSFGRVNQNQIVKQVVAFSNPTGETLEVANVQLTPPLIVEDITYEIQPGGEGSFKLVLGKERQPGAFEGLVRINFSTEKYPPITFEIEGYVIPPIEFKPYAAFFVVAHSGKQQAATIEIINHREQPLLLTGAKSDSNRFITKLETIETGQHYRLSLTLDGNAKPGKKKEVIILLTDPPMEKPLRVQANTIIREPVYTFPQSVDLGNLPLKVASDIDAVQTLSQTLMVYRPGTTDFEVVATVDLDCLDLHSERGPDGDRYQLTLTLIPEKIVPGKIEGTVRIHTNDEKYSVLEIPVSGYILD